MHAAGNEVLGGRLQTNTPSTAAAHAGAKEPPLATDAAAPGTTVALSGLLFSIYAYDRHAFAGLAGTHAKHTRARLGQHATRKVALHFTAQVVQLPRTFLVASQPVSQSAELPGPGL